MLKDPLFWITVISSLSAFGLFVINKKMLDVYYAKPVIEIVKMSPGPTEKDSSGGSKNRPLISVKIMNPTAFGNHILAELKKSRFSHTIIERGWMYSGTRQWGAFSPLPAFGSIRIDFFLSDEKGKKYINKEMTIIVKDIRGKESRKRFRYQGLPSN